MANKFTPLSETFLVSQQISIDDFAAIKDLGITLVVNNRPDGESPRQPMGADLKAAASDAGISYVEIPVGPSGISDKDLEALSTALKENEGLALGFCKSGMRSAILYSFAAARDGANIDALISGAAQTGFEIGGYRSTLEQLAGG